MDQQTHLPPRQSPATRWSLQFCPQLIPHSRAFLRQLITFTSTLKSSFMVGHIPAYVHSEIRWWQICAFARDGVRLVSVSYPSVHVFTDASGLRGLGGIYEIVGSLLVSRAVSGQEISNSKRYMPYYRPSSAGDICRSISMLFFTQITKLMYGHWKTKQSTGSL